MDSSNDLSLPNTCSKSQCMAKQNQPKQGENCDDGQCCRIPQPAATQVLRSPDAGTGGDTGHDMSTLPTGKIDGDDDNFLDAIVMAEEGFQDDGYKEGFAKGERSGFLQGRETGQVKGREVGLEVGFYLGFARVWKSLLEKQQGTKPRAVKALDSLLSMLQAFPVDNPHYDALWEDLKKIRAKFKQVASLLNVTIDTSDDSGGTTKPPMSF